MKEVRFLMKADERKINVEKKDDQRTFKMRFFISWRLIREAFLDLELEGGCKVWKDLSYSLLNFFFSISFVVSIIWLPTLFLDDLGSSAVLGTLFGFKVVEFLEALNSLP